MPTVTLLVNPVAGNGRARRVARVAGERLRSRGALVNVVTGATAAQLLARTATPLAVLPAGTGNDFARALGIPWATRRPPPTSCSTARTAPWTWGAWTSGGSARS